MTKPLVLIVEDEEPLTLLLRYNLEAEGYEVEVARAATRRSCRLRERVPDLLLLDWMLPGISGIELCRRLRARDGDARKLPIIMLTARGEEDERIRGLATGADDYVVKPFSVPELMARVRALLRRARPEAIARCSAGRRPGARPRDLPRPPRRPRGASRADRVPAARVPDEDAPAASSRASSFSTASGAATSMSTSAPSTSISAGSAGRSTAAAAATRSAPCAAPAIPSTSSSSRRENGNGGAREPRQFVTPFLREERQVTNSA